MKKILIGMLTSIFVVSILFIGVGCKEEATEEVEEATEEVEEATEEVEKLEGPVNFLAFSGWESFPEMFAEFEEMYGVTVNLVNFNANEEAYAKIKASDTGTFDLIMADSYWFQKYYEEGFVVPIDVTQLESYKTLHEEFKDIEIWRAPNWEDGYYLAYPSYWAPYPIVYNVDKVDPAPDSWGIFWEERVKGKVTFMDRPVEPLVMCGYYLGFDDPFNMTQEELDQVLEKMIELKPSVVNLWEGMGDAATMLINEEAWVSMSFNTGLAGKVITDSNGAVTCEAVMPKEGTWGWVDGTGLAKDAPHPEAALKFIDFFFGPEKMAERTKIIPASLTNAKAVEIVRDEMGNEDFIKYSKSDHPELLEGMDQYKNPGDLEAYQDVWNKFLAY